MNIGFYVSAVDGTKRFPTMLGPFDSKDAADAMVKPALDRAYALDARAWFMAWGVTKVTTPNDLPVGKLNKYMEV